MHFDKGLTARQYAAQIAPVRPVARWADLVEQVPPSPDYHPPEAIRELVKAHLRIYHQHRQFERKQKAAIEAAKSRFVDSYSAE